MFNIKYPPQRQYSDWPEFPEDLHIPGQEPENVLIPGLVPPPYLQAPGAQFSNEYIPPPRPTSVGQGARNFASGLVRALPTVSDIAFSMPQLADEALGYVGEQTGLSVLGQILDPVVQGVNVGGQHFGGVNDVRDVIQEGYTGLGNMIVPEDQFNAAVANLGAGNYNLESIPPVVGQAMPSLAAMLMGRGNPAALGGMMTGEAQGNLEGQDLTDTERMQYNMSYIPPAMAMERLGIEPWMRKPAQTMAGVGAKTVAKPIGEAVTEIGQEELGMRLNPKEFSPEEYAAARRQAGVGGFGAGATMAVPGTVAETIDVTDQDVLGNVVTDLLNQPQPSLDAQRDVTQSLQGQDVTVVANASEMAPEDLAAAEQGAEQQSVDLGGGIEGMRVNGKTYIFTDVVTDPARGQEVAGHETTHAGIQALADNAGVDVGDILAGIQQARAAEIQAWGEQTQYADAAPEVILEEYVANLAESAIRSGKIDSVLNKLIVKLRNGLKKMGFQGKDWSNREVLELLRDSKQAAADVSRGTHEADARMSMLGERSATADLDALAVAKKRRRDASKQVATGLISEREFERMEDEIRQDTGWMQGMDTKWRYELDDSQAKINYPEPTVSKYTGKERVPSLEGMTLGEALDHPELFKAHPDLMNIKMGEIAPMNKGKLYGSYDDSPREGGERMEVETDPEYTEKSRGNDPMKSMMHETQHAIQKREGFARGTSVGAQYREASKVFREEGGAERVNEMKAAMKQTLEAGKPVEPQLVGMLYEYPMSFIKDAIEDVTNTKLSSADYKKIAAAHKDTRKKFGDAYERYMRHYGEIEARDVESRLEMGVEERKQYRPLDEFRAKDPLIRYSAPGKAGFKKFFGASKVTNDKGRPKKVYHGSSAKNISELRTGRAGTIFFFEDEAQAKNYGKTVYPAYLAMDNPADLVTSKEHQQILIDAFNEDGGWAEANEDEMENRTSPDFDPARDSLWEIADYAMYALQDAGFDGVIQDEEMADGQQIAYGVFDADQVRMSPESEVDPAWFEGSQAVDTEGKPKVVYRGEHGESAEVGTHTREGSITYGSKEAANEYAMSPNVRADQKADNPKVVPAYLDIKKPVINTPDDPFIDATDIKKAIGRENTIKILQDPDIQNFIEETDNWTENFEGTVEENLATDPDKVIAGAYLNAYPVFSSVEFVEMFRKAGYDGVIHGGYGVDHEPEYKVFDKKQVKSAIGSKFGESDDIRFSTAKKGGRPARHDFSREQIDIVATEYNSGVFVTRVPAEDFISLTHTDPAALKKERFNTQNATDPLDLTKMDFDPKEVDRNDINAIPMLEIDVDGTIVGHEGRHRAASLLRGGATDMAVMIRPSPTWGASPWSDSGGQKPPRTLKPQRYSWTKTVDSKEVPMPAGQVLGRESSQADLDRAYDIAGPVGVKFSAPETPANTGEFDEKNPNVRFSAVFASPNENDDSNYADALEQVVSDDQRLFHQFGTEIDTLLDIKGEEIDGIGDWKDGAEATLVTKIDGPVDMKKLEMAAALKGVRMNQKGTLVFNDDPEGHNVMYEFVLPVEMAEARTVLEENDIGFRTLIPHERGTMVMLVDDTEGHDLEPLVAKLGADYDEEITITPGTSNLLGNFDNRRTGVAAQKRVIKSFLQEEEVTPELRDFANNTFRHRGRIEGLKKRPPPATKKRMKRFMDEVEGFKGIMPHLTPQEKENMVVITSAKSLMEFYKKLPTAKEMASVAWAGRAKKGWYKKSAQALIEIFGYADAPRFAALLAATSPQTGVPANLENALNIWVNWNKAGRPQTRAEIKKIMGQSVQGNKGEKSVLQAWENNTVHSLTNTDGKYILSGPKVNSFMENLLMNVMEVTNDTWQANYMGIAQQAFSGSGRNVAKMNPGKGGGYLAANVVTRNAAKILSRRTGETWTPDEIQETVWSWARTLKNAAKAGGKSAEKMLADAGLTHDMISDTEDFELLFLHDTYRKILEQGGYHDKIEDLKQVVRKEDRRNLTGRHDTAEGSGVTQETLGRDLRRAAKRLDKTKQEDETE